MAITRDALADYLADFLAIKSIDDYCPNGLQVAGQIDIHHIVTGVTACQALLDQAIALEAEAVMVHHGYFWRGESAVLTGYKHRRIASLLTHDINLFAYHLPLDVHPQIGNNAQFARHLQWDVEQWCTVDGMTNLLAVGRLPTPLDHHALTQVLTQQLQREPLCIAHRNAPIERIAWCTGAAQRYVEDAAMLGVDAYLTGEVSEQTTHVAREMGIDFFAAGHHATERYGIQALGEHLAEQFALKHTFVDIDNPA